MRRIWFWRLIRQSLLRQARSRTILVAAALAAAVLATVLSVYLQTDARLQREMRAYGANLVVSARRAGESLALARLTVALDELPASRRLGAAPYLQGVVSLARSGQAPAARAARTLLIGTDLTEYRRVSPGLILEGNWPLRADEALVGMEVADALRLAPGERVEVGTPDGSVGTFTPSPG